MKREMIKDCVAEGLYQHLIPRHAFTAPERPVEEANQCVVFCNQVAPNVFKINKGIAVVKEAQTCFDDGICMISPETKVVFVFE